MINFDEEIQKFQPSLAGADSESPIYTNDVTDIKMMYRISQI